MIALLHEIGNYLNFFSQPKAFGETFLAKLTNFNWIARNCWVTSVTTITEAIWSMILYRADYKREKKVHLSINSISSIFELIKKILTRHLLALMPQTPGHGSLHLLFMQAFDRSHSEFCTHSGRQPVYGSPKYSGKQRQEPAPLRSLQTAFAPHGDGEHGFTSSLNGGTKFIVIFRFN